MSICVCVRIPSMCVGLLYVYLAAIESKRYMINTFFGCFFFFGIGFIQYARCLSAREPASAAHMYGIKWKTATTTAANSLRQSTNILGRSVSATEIDKAKTFIR